VATFDFKKNKKQKTPLYNSHMISFVAAVRKFAQKQNTGDKADTQGCSQGA
jgi:hypothetical protein